MRRWLRQIFPSMFQRRLLLLMSVALVMVLVLGAQLGRLTLVQGAELRARAERALVNEKLIPTVRGRVLDRRGRVLAAVRPSYDIAVDYSVINGQWAYRQARWAAYRADKSAWLAMSVTQRERAVEPFLPEFREQEVQLWASLAELGGMSETEIELRRQEVVARVQQLAAHVWEANFRAKDAEMEDPVAFAEIAQPIREQTITHAIVEDVDEVALLPLKRMIALAADRENIKQRPELAIWREVRIESSRARYYPMETLNLELNLDTLPSALREEFGSESTLETEVSGVGLHLLGTMRRVWQKDVDKSVNPEARPFRWADEQGRQRVDLAGYLPGDQRGSWGVEASFEDRLRGKRGQEIEHLDTGIRVRQEPVAGQDVQLSIDIALQARITAIMDPDILQLMRVQSWHSKDEGESTFAGRIGDPLCGAAVVMDVRTGQVLAAVSTPGFSLEQLRRDSQSIWDDQINLPYMNRAFGRAYQPGSTVKPMIFVAAVTDGKIGPTDIIDCKGYYFPDRPTVFRDWIYKSGGGSFGKIAGYYAIARSSNYFFYALGDRLGPAGVVKWYDRFNVGRPTGTGLWGEAGGDLPALATPDNPRRGATRNDAILLAIGQGPVRWTVLQAAASYGTLGRGGEYLSPTLVLSPAVEQRRENLHLNRYALEEAMKGMYQSTNESYGTTNQLHLLGGEKIFNVENVKIFGKSGTAQTAPTRIDSNSDQRITTADQIVRVGNHAWFTGLVQREDSNMPDYAVAVVVEHGGSGGAVAGPVANQIIHALVTEGYLQ